ncbi:MAG: hypothetical protein AB8E74_08045, partial [Prochlorococcus sp.]
LGGVPGPWSWRGEVSSTSSSTSIATATSTAATSTAGTSTTAKTAITPLQVRLLLLTAAISSAVGLVLELLLVTQASYLVGDATLATGVVVGTFLAAMGLGAWLSQFLATGPAPLRLLLQALLLVELLLSPICLLGPLGLFAIFAADGPIWLAVVVLTLLVGGLGGWSCRWSPGCLKPRLSCAPPSPEHWPSTISAPWLALWPSRLCCCPGWVCCPLPPYLPWCRCCAAPCSAGVFRYCAAGAGR